ncbi:MAG TPA: transketolase [Methylomirabilota bacterium]|jgi:transketolase|nr:transketolase [Methylomirabilota bacterium]
MSAQEITTLQTIARRLRVHSLRSTAEAGSGHPTSCLSAADIVSAIFFHAMRFDPVNPANPNNDRFVLSKGHAAPVLYAALAEAGALPGEQLLSLRKFSSDLEGHPTPRLPWVGAATGSLGQGLSVGVGMALNGKYLDKLDYQVYVLLGDGEITEGGVWEAAALASYYQLDNLIGVIDVNGLGQSQRTMYDHDVEVYARRFAAFGWDVRTIDGHDLSEIVTALDAVRSVNDRPAMIVARTVKGKGVSFLEDREGWHGKPLKKGDELESALRELPLNGGHGPFPVARPPAGSVTVPLAAGVFPTPTYQLGEKVATRSAYGTALAKLGAVDPRVVALDGDTKNSTFAEKFLATHKDRYFECFIAEQNMVGAAVGLAACGKIPFVSTFAAFLTRAFDHIRMAAISGVSIKYVGSHCGVSIGEDGPSQMGLEDLAMMRTIPHSTVLYPSDAVSAEKLTALAASLKGATYIRTSRPATPVIYANTENFPSGGSKTLRASTNDRLTIVAAGVTVHEALTAYETLKANGMHVRILDAYSVKPLDAQGILQAAGQTNKRVLVVEDHYYDGGLGDAVLNAMAESDVRVHKMAVTEVPRSGKPEELLDAYGISARRIVEKVKSLTKL